MNVGPGPSWDDAASVASPQPTVQAEMANPAPSGS